ncbi:MAG: DNA repair exonuclease [Ferrovum myxofaciens]|uniref:metallophosphoesterase family protein n=1 Tax=Ferrovum myxofaciens TaxID=416213 RepID=UPI002356AECA|nr:DNA repair exonuclease [Ferrovum myxofaciens]QKE40025.1 MAG: DNA repair exonuclease [Ferrovum myxofaciens]
MRFLHAADLHIDSPLRGLDRYEGAPVDDVRGATRRTFENLIATALRERVDLVVIGGDLYDGDWPDHNTGLFFVKGVTQLAEEGIPVAIVRGNHDAASKLTKSLRLPRNVHLLADAKPETVVLDQIGVAVHGQSFVTPAVLDDLASAYPHPIPDCFNIGLLHTSLNGRPGHDNYAPTTLSVLQGKGYDYWALGHVHAAEIVSREPWVVYPGNTQGRHIRESGAKGCSLLSVENGTVLEHKAIALDVMRWETLSLDIAALPDLDALLDAATAGIRGRLAQAEGRILAIRVRIAGSGPLHRMLAIQPETVEHQLRSAAIEASNAQVWIEKVELTTRPQLDLDRIAERDDPLGLLVRELRGLVADDAARSVVAEEAIRDLQQKLPVELREGPHALLLDAPDVLAEFLREVEGELIARLSGEGTTS